MEVESNNNSGAPRGSPIYLPSTVGPLSTIKEFRSSILNLLHDFDTTHLSHQFDLSTDSLKVYTKEELTAMAMNEAFQKNNLELEQSLNVSLLENQSSGSGRSLRETKRRRAVKKTDEDYVANAEQLANLKQKQKEDKAAAVRRLHCFSKTCDNGKDTQSFEQMQSLKYIDNYTIKPSHIKGEVDTLFPQVILCVEIYKTRKLKTQEFLVLGRQMSTELKDKIHCITDQVMEKAGKYDPSGYFLIEDVFHNDLRNPSARDYSQHILDWLWNSGGEALEKWECILTGDPKRKQRAILGEVKPTDLPRFRSADMQITRFCDIKFRLGENYLYCHQGDCKHMMVIRDMRLIHPEDVQDRAAYPRLMYQMKARYQKCSICNISRATKFAVDVKWAKENPCYFCHICLASLHLDGDSLNSDFPIYDYLYE